MDPGFPKNRQGLCIGVLSGDRILFQGPPDHENGGYKQKLLHLSGIQAPKIDPINPAKEEKYAYASREFMRKSLVGKKLKFIIQKKVNETQIGYVLMDNGKDATTALLREGLARTRGEKVHGKNAQDYIDAQQQAKMAEVGVWNDQTDTKTYRRLINITDKQFAAKFKGKSLKGIAEQIHPSKAVVYFPTEGYLININYCDIQVVVLSEKLKNGETKNNARAIRSLIESDFLQREVVVHVAESSNGESIFGYLVNDTGNDVRKVLLENGHAKLAKQAINNLPTKDFIELKNIAHKALDEGKGLWKEQKITKNQASSAKQFFAYVYEIHSGDSISVYNPIKKQIIRVFFPNVRAPSNGKPYAFEAKQALRKKCIGKKVKVEVEFTKMIKVKKFQGDIGQDKKFIFASVFQTDTNLPVFMLETGFITIQNIRVEEDMSKYLEEMKTAEQKSKKAKKGLHSKIDIKLPTFNDISGGKNKKVDSSKAKQLFEFLKDEDHLTGTVQLILNGSRFKVRFHQQHIMAIVVIDGIRCLPNDEPFTKISEQALSFSKLNALQRDFEIKVRRVDLKGIYHATLIHNKRDFAYDLLESGLAVTVARNKNREYEDLEAEARKKKTGLWKHDFNLVAIKGGDIQKQFKPVNFTKKLVLVEVVNTNQFYLQSSGCKKIQVPQKAPQAPSIKLGQLYAAQFTVDGIYYRARVVRETKGGYQVFFIDYGNYDVVQKSKICTIDESLKKIKSPLFHCSLYGLQGFTREAENILRDYINVDMKVEMKEQADDGEYRVVLYDPENNNRCVNLELLEYGEAQNTTTNDLWEKTQQTARRNRQGKWNDE